MWLSTVVDGRLIGVVHVHGGVKFYRGAAKAARAYVERDPSRADDYYLGEGTGVAERLTATPDGVERAGSMNGDTYEQWVAGIDVETGAKKGRLLKEEHALRFVEVSVNGPKTWSLAAALHPDISAALDAAQDKAASEIVGWVASHATTRVGPRGRQVQVPVEKIEAAVVRHYTSRAGDPHRHLHLQIKRAGVRRGRLARPPLSRLPRLDRGHQRHRPCGGRDRPHVPFRARRAWLDPPSRNERDPRAGAIRRRLQRQDLPDSAQCRPLRGRVAR